MKHDTHELRADVGRYACVHTDELEWTASPSPGVTRKRLELRGPIEAGRVTSVVRYAPGSRFPPHPHPDGEEILVLEGVFSDERGDHPAGTFMLNPEGYAHAPYSEPGCTLLVKLRQYPGQGRTQVRVRWTEQPWEAYAADGVERIVLYAEPGHPEQIQLVRFARGVALGAQSFPGGEEIFVLAGVLSDEHGEYRAGSWVRFPPGSSHSPASADGCTLYVKKDHLASPQRRLEV